MRFLSLLLILTYLSADVVFSHEDYDLEHWSTVFLVRSNGKNFRVYYLKKHQLDDIAERDLMESIRIQLDPDSPVSRLFSIRFRQAEAPDLLSKEISERDADVIQKVLMNCFRPIANALLRNR